MSAILWTLFGLLCAMVIGPIIYDFLHYRDYSGPFDDEEWWRFR